MIACDKCGQEITGKSIILSDDMMGELTVRVATAKSVSGLTGNSDVIILDELYAELTFMPNKK